MGKRNKGIYPIIDCGKVFMAIFIVAIHTLQPYITTLPYIYSKIITTILGLAVPYFFVASGFLLCNKLKEKNQTEKISYMQTWLKRLLRLYFFWTIIYLPYAIIGFCNDNLSFIKSIIIYIRNVIFVGENYLSWPLWYLLAMIISGLIYYIILIIKPKRYIPVLIITTIFLIILREIINSNLIYNDWYFSLFKSTRNGFFLGFPYMTIGFIISLIGYSRNIYTVFTLMIISIITQILGCKYSSYITIYLLFSIILSIQSAHIDKDTCKKIRLTSVVIYFVHMLWVGILFLCFNISSLYMFIYSLFLSIITSYVVIINKNNKIIKLLFE